MSHFSAEAEARSLERAFMTRQGIEEQINDALVDALIYGQGSIAVRQGPLPAIDIYVFDEWVHVEGLSHEERLLLLCP